LEINGRLGCPLRRKQNFSVCRNNFVPSRLAGITSPVWAPRFTVFPPCAKWRFICVKWRCKEVAGNDKVIANPKPTHMVEMPESCRKS
jgi:hypothetical protein